jgi:hypothetical protein
MDQVQDWLSAGGNGRGREGKSSAKEEDVPEGDDVLKGLVERLAGKKEESGGDNAERSRPYPDQEIDLPGLDVPPRDEP